MSCDHIDKSAYSSACQWLVTHPRYTAVEVIEKREKAIF